MFYLVDQRYMKTPFYIYDIIYIQFGPKTGLAPVAKAIHVGADFLDV